MKTVATLICLLGFCYPVFSQNSENTFKNCSLAYSEALEAYVYESSAENSCNVLVIQSLPPQSQTYVHIRLSLLKGTYYFKRSEDLQLPDNCLIYIEDNLTGQVFDLRSNESNSFNVIRNVSDRFVLYIKPEGKLASKNTSPNKGDRNTD